MSEETSPCYDIVSMVADFCDAFLGRAELESGLAFEDRLERERLDFSLESLDALDRYLGILHRHRDEVPEPTFSNTIVAAGCYLGETIRRNASVRYEWINYDDYFRDRPDLARIIPYGVGTCAVLVSATGRMTMPINKVGRFVTEGAENSTRFYAHAEIASCGAD